MCLSTKEINLLERAFMEFIDYNLMVKGAKYAKYYFKLDSLSVKVKGEHQLQSVILRMRNEINNCEQSGCVSFAREDWC